MSTFVPTAVLFLLFSLPLFLFCRDHHPAPKGTRVPWREAFADVAQTVRDARRFPGVLRFIVCSFIYQDAVGTIAAYMGLYAVKAVGFGQEAVNTLFVVLTVPAIVGSYICGRLVDRYGAKRALMWVLGSWVVLLALIMLLPGRPAFWAVGALIGLVFGGVPAAERPLLLSLIPEAEAGRFFSLMLLSARAAAFLGPLVWGYTVVSLEPALGAGVAYRAAIGTVAFFFFTAALVLRAVPNRREPPTAAPAAA